MGRTSESAQVTEARLSPTRSVMERLSGGAIVLLAIASPSVADLGNPSVEVAAVRRVIRAEAGNSRIDALRSIAADRDIDPWIVAEQLVLFEESGALENYLALLQKQQDVDDLSEYLKCRRAIDREAALWRQFELARGDRLADRPERALKRLAQCVQEPSVLGVLSRFEAARSQHSHLGAPASVASWMAGAAKARKLGWEAGYRYGLSKFAYDAAYPRSATGGRASPPAGAYNGLLQIGKKLGQGESVLRCFRQDELVLVVIVQATGVRAEIVGAFDQIAQSLSKMIERGSREPDHIRSLVKILSRATKLTEDAIRVRVSADGILAAFPFEGLFPKATVARLPHFPPRITRDLQSKPADGALLIDTSEAGTLDSAVGDGVFDSSLTGARASRRELELLLERGKTWRAIVIRSGVSQAVRPLHTAFKLADGRFSLGSLNYVLRSRELRVGALVIAGEPFVHPAERTDDSTPRPRVILTSRRIGSVVALACPVGDKSRRAFLAEFLTALQSAEKRTAVTPARAAAIARTTCAEKGGFPIEELFAWQVWTARRVSE